MLLQDLAHQMKQLKEDLETRKGKFPFCLNFAFFLYNMLITCQQINIIFGFYTHFTKIIH